MKVVAKVTGSEEVRRTLLRIGAQGAQRALAATAEDVEDYVHGQAAKHTKTGALARSVTKAKLSPLAWLVGHDSSAPYALFVHWGTKPHTIAPRRKKVLRWAVDGKSYPSEERGPKGFFRFAGKVHHPGYKGDPYLVRAAALAPDIFARHLANIISKGA